MPHTTIIDLFASKHTLAPAFAAAAFAAFLKPPAFAAFFASPFTPPAIAFAAPLDSPCCFAALIAARFAASAAFGATCCDMIVSIGCLS